MDKAYSRIEWQNEPAITTPINEVNLNKMDYAIDVIDNRVVELSESQEAFLTKEEVSSTYATKEEVDSELTRFKEEVTDTYATREEVEGISETVTEIATEVSKGKADVILVNAQGESIHATDSTDSKAVEFALLGKATQNGTPTPSAPIDITVSGADGSVEVKSLGKNFIPYPYYEKNHTDNGVEWTNLGDGRLKANGTATANSDYFIVSYNAMRTFKAGTYIVNGCPNGGGESTHSIIVGKKVNSTLTRIALANESGTTLTLTEDTEIYILCRVNAGQTVSNLIFEPMISLEGGKFEPYKESTTTITTEGGLAGINGVCDEIVKYADGSGKHIQKIGKKTITSVSSKVASTKNNMFMVSVPDMKAPATNNYVKPLLCTHFEAKDSYTTLYNKDSAQITTHQNKYIILCFGLNENFDTVAEVNTWLATNNVTVLYELAEPIITDLSAEEVAEMEVQTFYPTTNILNDANCGMEVTYKADTKNYIDKIIGERITALETALINNI
jgi:hypothetical protein